VKKGAIIGLGAGCFVVVFAVAVLALSGSGLALNQNEIPTAGIEEIQSEFDYMKTLPRTQESLETIMEPLIEDMMERPSVIDTCTKLYNLSTEASFELAETDDFNSDGVWTDAELEYAIANSPLMSNLYENKAVLAWCVMQVQFYPDKFPDAISNEEFQQRLVESHD